jgi:hypothetical protein
MRSVLLLAVGVLVVALTHSEPPLPPIANPGGSVWEAPSYLPSHPDDATLEMDARLLASLALAEDPQAPAAVMWTAVNRARACGCSLLEAITTGQAYGTTKRWSSGTVEWRPSWGRKWSSAWAHQKLDQFEVLAYRVLTGLDPDPTYGATHFHRRGTWEPPWAPPLTARLLLGSHYFYRELSRPGSV